MGGDDWDGATSLKCDAAGNVYTIGLVYDTADFDPGPGVYELFPNTGPSLSLTKLDPAGNFLWAKLVSGNGGLNQVIGWAMDFDLSGKLLPTRLEPFKQRWRR